MRTTRRQNGKRAQNTAEYLIMLVLIAVGSIGLFTLFGNAIRTHMHNVVAAFVGSKDTLDHGKTAEKAKTIAKKQYGMGNTDTQDVEVQRSAQ